MYKYDFDTKITTEIGKNNNFNQRNKRNEIQTYNYTKIERFKRK